MAPCASAMALTIDSPRPRPPPALVRAPVEALERLEQARQIVGRDDLGPVFATVRMARPRTVRVAISMPSAGAVVLDAVGDEVGGQAFDEALVSVGAGGLRASTLDGESARVHVGERLRDDGGRGRSARGGRARAGCARGRGAPRSAVPAARSGGEHLRAHGAQRSSTVMPGSASATSMSVRSNVSGVRSSCETFAANWRWAVKAASRRSSSASKVRPSWRSSSSGPSSARRRCRLLAEMSWAVAVIVAQRAQRPPGDDPAEPGRDQRHDRERDPRLYEEGAERGMGLGLAPSAGAPEATATGRRGSARKVAALCGVVASR